MFSSSLKSRPRQHKENPCPLPNFIFFLITQSTFFDKCLESTMSLMHFFRPFSLTFHQLNVLFKLLFFHGIKTGVARLFLSRAKFNVKFSTVGTIVKFISNFVIFMLFMSKQGHFHSKYTTNQVYAITYLTNKKCQVNKNILEV